jgi:hypothetical protein
MIQIIDRVRPTVCQGLTRGEQIEIPFGSSTGRNVKILTIPVSGGLDYYRQRIFLLLSTECIFLPQLALSLRWDCLGS